MVSHYFLGGKVMGRDDKRFEKVYSQGSMNVMEIWVDKETGVNYVCHAVGEGVGFTPLLDKDGKPVISSIDEFEK